MSETIALLRHPHEGEVVRLVYADRPQSMNRAPAQVRVAAAESQSTDGGIFLTSVGGTVDEYAYRVVLAEEYRRLTEQPAYRGSDEYHRYAGGNGGRDAADIEDRRVERLAGGYGY